MQNPNGKYYSLSPIRCMVNDLMHFSMRTPTVTANRRMALGPLVEARAACRPRPSWTVMFTKAFAMVAQKQPELRRSFRPFPVERIYEHPFSVAAVAVEREDQGELGVFLPHLKEPENRTIAELNDEMQRYQTESLETFRNYRRMRRVARMPRLIRRFLWWAYLNWTGPKRAKVFGTFGISSPAVFGAGMITLQSVLASNLHYGLFDDDGNLDVYLTFDHRVYDGAVAARALTELEQVLLNEIREELQEERVETESTNLAG